MTLNAKQAVAALAALAQETRLEVFRLLVRHGELGLPAGEIAETLAIAPTTLSFHLSQLVHAGLADSRRNGRSIIYFIHIDGIRSLLAYLTEDCCGGHPELCHPQAAVAPCPEGVDCQQPKAGQRTGKPRGTKRTAAKQGRPKP